MSNLDMCESYLMFYTEIDHLNSMNGPSTRVGFSGTQLTDKKLQNIIKEGKKT